MKIIKHQYILIASLVTGLLSSPTAFSATSRCVANYVLPPNVKGATITGSSAADQLIGTNGSDIILSGGLSQGAEGVRGRGGSDYLVFRSGDSVATNMASDSDGHIRVRDFIIDDTAINFEADSISLCHLIVEDNLNATTIGDYIHFVSVPLFGWARDRSAIYINVEGDYTAADRQALDDGAGHSVGNGADLYIELLAEQGNNNIEEVTGHPDNSIEQLQALIDMGFLKVSANDIFGSTGGDKLEGTTADETFYPRGVFQAVESIRGNGGADRLVFEKSTLLTRNLANDGNEHYRIRDLTIGDVQVNPEADSILLGDLIGQLNLNASNVGNYLHIMSGVYGYTRTGIFINVDGDFSTEDRNALEANPSLGGHGADVFLEFQGQLVDNNLETLTGYVDNSIDQLQTIIDWGFLDFTMTTSTTSIFCI